MKTSQCATLAEYRREVLRCPQSVIASKAKVKQGWISQVELGHCPTPWKRDALLSAYKLTDREFVRMIGNAAKLKAAQHPMSDDMPLFATATASKPAEVIQLVERLEVKAQARA